MVAMLFAFCRYSDILTSILLLAEHLHTQTLELVQSLRLTGDLRLSLQSKTQFPRVRWVRIFICIDSCHPKALGLHSNSTLLCFFQEMMLAQT
jgi:hypothetical protein